MAAPRENDKVNNKGAQDDGESGQLKPADIPDSVQSQDETQQNQQMHQGVSPSEATSEPPLDDHENVQRIQELEDENRLLKKRNKELTDENAVLRTEKNSLQEQINNLQGHNLNQVQTEGSTSADTSNRSGGAHSVEGENRERLLAETSAHYIFKLFTMTTQGANKSGTVTITTEDDVKHMDQSHGLYVCYLKANIENSVKQYPIYVGVGKNLRKSFQDHIFKKNRLGKAVPGLVRKILSLKSFPGNLEAINLDPSLYVIILKLEYASMNFLKLVLLNHFDFCLNRYNNGRRRMNIEILDQCPFSWSPRWIRLKGLWQTVIEECNAFNSSQSALEDYETEDDSEDNI